MGGTKNIFLLGSKKIVVKTFVLLKYFFGVDLFLGLYPARVC